MSLRFFTYKVKQPFLKLSRAFGRAFGGFMAGTYVASNNTCCGLRELVDVYYLRRVGDLPELPKGYLIFATTIDDDPDYDRPERLLERAGFRLITTFRNPNSGNPVNFWVKAPGI